MKIVRAHDYGGIEALVVDEIPAPSAAEGEVVVAVEAAGVNFADALMVAGRYQIKPEPPFAPGFEAAGTIVEVGAGVAGLTPGMRVVATPPFGCFAEQIAVSPGALLPLPDGLDPVTAVATAVTFGTAYHGLVDRARLAQGETLVVTGATGGVGSAAVQVGLALGAHVIAAVGSPQKVAPAERLGAQRVITYDDVSGLRASLREAAPEGTADVVFDTVGGDLFDPLVRSLGPGGRFLVVGFASGRIPELPVNLVLLKESAVMGVFWGAFRQRDPVEAGAQLDRVWAWLGEGRVALPPIESAPLEDAAAVLTRLTRREVVGKAVLLTDRGRAARR